jgi:hypothetical protein
MDQPSTVGTPVAEGNDKQNNTIDENEGEAPELRKANGKGRQARCEYENEDGEEVSDHPGKQMAFVPMALV